jgi:hypothetical protein
MEAGQALRSIPDYQTAGNEQRMEMRKELFPLVRTQALLQVTLLDRAILEFTTEMERAFDELTKYRDQTLEKLQKMKEELSRETETALAEVESTLAEDQPRLASRYGSAFRSLTEHLEPFALFSYSLKTSSPLSVVQLHATVHPPQQSSPTVFAALYENRLELYDLETQQTAQHSLTANTRYAGYVPLDGSNVLVVGEEVMILDVLSFKVTTRAPLLEPRYNPGVTKVGEVVFAFGGWDNGQLKVSEKYSIPDNSWTRLADMHFARGAFTPCHFQSLIYLAASYAKDHRAVESFNPQTETFEVLPVSLPLELRQLCGSVAFVANGELCLMTNERQMARWQIESEAVFRLTDLDRACWSNQEPLIVGTQVLIANEGKVLKFSLETYHFNA